MENNFRYSGHILWRLLTDPAARIKWMRGEDHSHLRQRFVTSHEDLKSSDLDFNALHRLSIELDKLLLTCVKAGRPPETPASLIARSRNPRETKTEGGPDMAQSEYIEALWLAISDPTFRREAFGNAREALQKHGLSLSDEELGKFRWFDADKLAAYGEILETKMVQAIASGSRDDASQDTSSASTLLAKVPEAALLSEEGDLIQIYRQHSREVEALRMTGERVAAGNTAYATGEFSPGVPVPRYPTFLNILQLMRVWDHDTNRILADTGYSFGRLSMIAQTLRNKGFVLPAWPRELLDERDRCDDWFTEATLQDRPKLKEYFHQSPCDPRSVVGRVEHIARHNWLRGRRVMVLGDDDGMSIALARFTEAEIHVVDIDPTVLEFLERSARRSGLQIHTHLHDLREPLPPDLVGRFWLVSADPPQAGAAERVFIDRAIEALTDQLALRIYVSVTPLWMGDYDFQEIMAHTVRRGFGIREVLKSQMRFNVRHPFDTPGGQSDAAQLLEDALRNTLNMACDVHVLERMVFP